MAFEFLKFLRRHPQFGMLASADRLDRKAFEIPGIHLEARDKTRAEAGTFQSRAIWIAYGSFVTG